MTEEQAFLRGIQDDPDDDGRRLVFADWLEERADPRAEFIRLQVALEALRRPCADPLAEFERCRRLARIPPGEIFPRDDWPIAQQINRERELLRAHKATWFGPLAQLEADHSTHLFAAEFRRGFVSSVEIALTALGQQRNSLRAHCPLIRSVTVFGTLGRGRELASCPALDGVAELNIAGWLGPDDVRALAAAPHLAELHSLKVWMGNRESDAACQLLASIPTLREVTLVQLWGGIDADDPEGLDQQADAVADQLRGGRLNVRVERPFDRLFPLDGKHIGYNIDAGHLPDGRATLICEARQPVLMYFDDAGRFVREEQLDLRPFPVKPGQYSWEDFDGDELLEVLTREIGFVPGPIFVREFDSQLCEVGVHCWAGHHAEELQDPDAIEPAEAAWVASLIHGWLQAGNFELPYGNQYWADGLGRIHTS